LLSYDSNSDAYHIFNKDFGCFEITCDAVFDETNGFQVEQLDLYIVDDEEAPCDALQRMAIGDVRPQDSSEQQEGLSPNYTTPPTQESNQNEEMDQDEHNDQVQEESIDQGRDEDCHTPFREIGNEASIRVPRMFKSHAWQQYDKQMQCY
jgi:hypothetical protein